jgi:hypothetical protein
MSGQFRGQSRKGEEQALRSAVSALMMLVVLVTGLVPAGMMPTRDADGHLTVVLCTTQGLRSVTLDAAGREVPAQDEDTDRSPAPCLFATAVALAAVADPAWQPSFTVAEVSLQPTGHGDPLSRLQPLPLGARAPPVTL